jgi:hypothetical protein
MPLSSRKAARETPRRDLPAYFLSIACNRQQNASFRDLIEQMLVLFLRTEVESTSSDLAALLSSDPTSRSHDDKEKDKYRFKLIERAARFYDDFAGEDETAKSRQSQAAYSWVLYALGLDQFSLNYPDSTVPWNRILMRTRERILQDLSENTITSHIKRLVGNDKSALSRKQLREVQEAFDIELKLEGLQDEYTREDRGILVRAIQNAAYGQSVGLPIEYGRDGRYRGGSVDVFPLTDKVLRVMDGFLSELEKFYRDSVNALDMKALEISRMLTPSKRITRFRQKNLKDCVKDENTQAILVSIGTSPLYIGGALIRPYDPSKSDEFPPDQKPPYVPRNPDDLTEACKLGSSLELFFLWTPPQYRHFGVAGAIVRKAKEELKERNFKYLVVEIFRTMNEQIAYFVKKEFVFDTQHVETGRLVYQYKNPDYRPEEEIQAK